MTATQLPLDGGNTVGDNSAANAATVGCFFVKEAKRLCEGGDGLIMFGGAHVRGNFVEMTNNYIAITIQNAWGGSQSALIPT